MQQHKYNYGVIGNCAFLALVSKDANIGWMCLPRFDSSFVFGTLLDDEKGGRFSIQPEWDSYTSEQSYLFNTNILETTFDCDDGKFRVVDFAPRFENLERIYKPLMLIRKIVPIEGRPRVRVICNPVGDYGKIQPKKVFGSSHIRYEGLESPLRITTNIALNFIDSEQAFVLNEPKYIILTWGVPLEAALKSSSEIYLRKTTAYWRRWVKNTAIEHFHQKAIIRSALTLKLHQYQDTGAIIAAATTSLPEFPGSTRNWDYRFCWMRDAHYTLKALSDMGHFGILQDYANFVENIAINEDGRMHPLHPIALDREPKERILPLKGYKGERPVRIGNQAYEHTQNDVYGQVLVTLLPFFTDQRLKHTSYNTILDLVRHSLKMIEETMDEPDNGLWEFRGIHQLHSYTFLFHWAGSNAALKIAKITGDEKMKALASSMVKRSSEMIEKCYDEERGVYTQAVDSKNLDASLLQLINMGYLDPTSEKAKRHLKVLEDELLTENGLFYRYKHIDDFGKPESTFLICSFWYVEALARMNRVEDAIHIFENLLKHGNHLGLLSEDVDAETGSQWGNFPQMYSHVGLINAAFTISRKLDKPIFL
ncbi:MAG: glycoside hydrolase family 15 protein [Bacteroidetes bacterium]|jgi:GH15 family glucan-1,4-alpha-glucosidase|nr:glycoside hydrolase family 15 protein [Bacteroidota bacterium]MDF1866218.1 glycoside hydrolase family 15 protein [Saprospiraceae bacterium]